ncbi:hypothetical protein [Pseudodesulfovibrio sediminis]|uniref:Type VI secretion system spike protein VgrG3-like C-terminal domain-containing protein n=1 Tax=Pseudodesulfovibrio sediminis TaxID=2810563 RepID=A0ABN6EPU6_9BACT|nr:hypothetical protein [Pseudodesulfovibrio sediminis]BCS87467.1 hypothetical protein PSDVSF_07090 [Pseudodesulfovibrio sediminis]
MSVGNIGDNDILKTVQAGVGSTDSSQDTERNKQLMAAFDAQMNMAQSLFREGSDEYGEGSSSDSFDISMINDSRMVEALATISRLMRTEGGLERQSFPRSSRAASGGQETAQASPAVTPYVPGDLSAQFESGDAGVAAVGYDRVGGTSYGKYQIASKPGTMDRFLTFLDEKAPEWGERLRSAGASNTGSTQGAMPNAWKALAAENPAEFEKMQHDFIAGETYEPARNMILQQTGLDFNNAPPALQEVLWSTSVQHGPTGAAKIVGRVIDRFAKSVSEGDFNTSVIEGVYDSRKGQFSSSTARVQRAVASRMDTEKELALNMLGTTNLSRIV